MNKKKSPLIKKPLLIAAIVLCLAGFGLLVLEKTHVIDLFHAKTPASSTTGSSSRPVNDVSYTPATPGDNASNDIKKQDGSIDKTPVTTPDTTSPISVVLSAAAQDTKGGPVVVRAILNNLSGGKCTLTLTRGSTVRTYSTDVTWLGTYYGCNGFDVPYSDLSVGDWNLKLVVTQNTNSGQASQMVSVEAP